MRTRSTVCHSVFFATLLSAGLAAQDSSKAWLGVVVEGTRNGPAEIVEVDAASPAAKAGLAVGDRILRFGNTAAGDVDSFIRKIQASKAGSRVVLTVRRAGKTWQIPVRLGSAADAAAAKKSPAKNAASKEAAEKAAAKAKAAADHAAKVKAEVAKRAAEVKAELAKREAEAKAMMAKRAAEAKAMMAKREAEAKAVMAKREAEAKAMMAKQKAEVKAELAKRDAKAQAEMKKREAQARAAIAARRAKSPQDVARDVPRDAPAQQGRGRAFLGVTLELGARGARIGQITSGSAAERARIQSGDVIIEADGQKVRTREQLVRAIQKRRPGQSLPLVLQRGSKRMKMNVVLGRAGEPVARGRADSEARDLDAQARNDLERARAALRRARASAGNVAAAAAKKAEGATPKDSSAASSPAKSWEVDFDKAMRRARAEGKPVLVDFTAKWSGPCRMLSKNFASEGVAASIRDFVCVRVDVDRQERLADRFEVNSIPHVALLSPAGKKIGTFTGYLGAKELAAKMGSWKNAAQRGNVAKAIGRAMPSAKNVTGKVKVAEAVSTAKSKLDSRPSQAEIDALRKQVRGLVDAQKRMRVQLDRLIEMIGRKGK